MAELFGDFAHLVGGDESHLVADHIAEIARFELERAGSDHFVDAIENRKIGAGGPCALAFRQQVAGELVPCEDARVRLA